MAIKIPTYTATTALRGEKQQNKQVSAATPSAFGAAIGQGLQELANGTMSVARAMEYRQDLKNEADARMAADAYRGVVRDAQYNPNTGYMNATGGNALGGRRDSMLSDLEARRNEIAKGLTPAARKIFDEAAMSIDNGVKDSAIRHESSELRSYTMGALQASAEGNLEDAIRYANNDDKFNGYLATSIAETERAAALAGKSAEETSQAREAVVSSALAGRTLAFAKSDPILAFEYLKSNADKLNPETYNSLFTALEPAYYAAEARNWVSAQNATAGSQAVGYGGFPSFIVGPESSGNAKAYNQASGAAGIVQFIPSTWLGLIDQIKPAWADGMSKDEILAMRNDPATVLPIYNVFRAQNARTLENAGIPVTPASEYVAHHFGAGGAVALYAAAAQGDGSAGLTQALNARGINTAKWVEQNPWMQGKTVNGAITWFENKTAAFGGANPTINPTLSMQDALEISDPKLRDAVLKELTLRAQVAQQTRTEQTRINNESAWDIIDNGGTPDDIPLELRAAVGAQTMNTIFDTFERSQAGADFTNEGRYLELFDMAMSTDRETQKRFRELDLNDDRPNLSQGDLRQLKTMQAELNQAEADLAAKGPPEVTMYTDADYRSANKDAEGQFMGAMGVASAAKMSDDQRRRLADMQLMLRQGMRNFANSEGRAMSFEERTSFVNKLLAPVVIEGVDRSWWPGNAGDVRLFEAPELARGGQAVELQYGRIDVPSHIEKKIAEQLTEAFGRAPTADEIVEQYENEVMLELGMTPSFEYDDIPRDTKNALRAKYPDASPEQLVDIFRVLTLEAANRVIVQ